MTTSPITETPTSAPAARTPGPTGGGAAKISTDFQMFLKMLTAQMKNQDPLNPMDNAQMTTQMSQINMVSGIETVNDTLKTIASQFGVFQQLQGTALIGREALVRRKEHPMRKLVGLTMEGDVSVGHGDHVYVGRAQVGEITSAMRSPILGKTIALARMDVTHAEIGTEVEVGKLDGYQKRLPAHVVAFAHYDPKKTRPQS